MIEACTKKINKKVIISLDRSMSKLSGTNRRKTPDGLPFLSDEQFYEWLAGSGLGLAWLGLAWLDWWGGCFIISETRPGSFSFKFVIYMHTHHSQILRDITPVVHLSS